MFTSLHILRSCLGYSDHDFSFSSGEGGLPHQARVFSSIYNYLYFSGTSELETKVLETCLETRLGTPLQRVAFQRSKILLLQNLQGVRTAEGSQERTLGRHRVHSHCSSKSVWSLNLCDTLITFLIAVTQYSNKAANGRKDGVKRKSVMTGRHRGRALLLLAALSSQLWSREWTGCRGWAIKPLAPTPMTHFLHQCSF